MTGETLYEDMDDENFDEDYLDPHYLHSAAELYNNPDMFYELQGQLESAHGGPNTAGLQMDPMEAEFLRGLNYDPYNPSGTYDISPRPGEMYPDTQLGIEHEDSEQTLSPQQYALLMNSMKEPLAMYTSSLHPDSAMGGGEYVYEQDTSAMEFDPMARYSDGLYSTSPMYERGDDTEGEHPALSMMDGGYPETQFGGGGPRPPTRLGF